ncbi:MAG TPA: hypothetical protein VNK49_02125 [Anaerolineales bacterium]|nr:hypothetical protein [Anaerolineales bacterium]
MNSSNFQRLHPANLNRYRDPVIQLARRSWAPFMWHNAFAREHWHNLFDHFSEYQAVIVETSTDRPVAIGHSLPFRWEEDLANLPEEGWDWVIQKAIHDHKEGIQPNLQAALFVAVQEEYQKHGLSMVILQILREIAASKGFNHLVVPVRPSEKSKYPLISMDDYITWKTQEGLPFDAWLRVHIRAGGKIIKICHQSKTIHGSRAEWEEWTGMKFPQSGLYVIPGALNPIEINIEKNEGVYIEPNVWVAHSMA